MRDSESLSQTHMHKRCNQKPNAIAIANDAQRPTILDHVNFALMLNDVCMLRHLNFEGIFANLYIQRKAIRLWNAAENAKKSNFGASCPLAML